MIRKLKLGDSEKLEAMLRKIPNFNSREIEVAMELINIAESNPAQKDYNIYVFENDGKVFGYHCTGKRPLTDAVYDLYWIAADPEATVKGIGKKLLEHAEEFVRQSSGRWLIAETSSRQSYTRTRNFYLRNNYSIVAEINDFYSAGDNLVVFGKFFSQP
ncbi:MAG TPA: GNAT family N-acetyltransferase [Ignavibacteriaceae bacterium]|nr:GNAT family N-acetyltransferase [Ignavibacteriaceae bacterium]